MSRVEKVNIDENSYDIGEIASTSNLGMVQIGEGLSITSEGVLSATGGGGGLDPATTFWGQTANNGKVEGRIILGKYNIIVAYNDDGTIAGDFGFDTNGCFFMQKRVGVATPSFINFPTNDTGIQKATQMKLMRVAPPLSNQPDNAATKGYTDVQVSLSLTPFPESIFNQILEGQR